MLFHRFVLGDMVTNSYILADEGTRSAVLFDAPADAGKIVEYIEKNNLVLKGILLTHAHFDHIMALSEVKARTGAKLYLHCDEKKYLEDSSLNLSGELGCMLKPVEADVLLKDNDILEFDGIKLKVIHTPGHTTGSVCYLGEGFLISGDTLFAGSIGRYDFPLGSFDDEIKSIKEKLMPLDDEIKVYPGHGFSTTIGKQRKENSFLI